ncbi:sugar transferase, partial [bacterium]|nr:sugar transferase [bacterium]
MIVFSFAKFPDDDGRDAAIALRAFLSDRLRITDIAGWIDERTVGVLLPRATGDEARVVASDVVSRLGSGVPTPAVSVFTFPGDWDSNGDGGRNGDSVPHSLHRLMTDTTPAWKRVLDVTGATIAIVVVAPVLLLVAVAIKLASPGPVIYRQLRMGLGGRPFIMYKFRTMCVDAEARQSTLMQFNERSGPAFKLRSDPRVTPLGRVLRRWSLDELPQLFNVLTGDMSLVGPRPLPVKEARLVRDWHRRRHDAVPGITGLWQVVARDDPDFDRWVRLDIEYLRRRHLALDLKILF